jgi:hypothetical protein
MLDYYYALYKDETDDYFNEDNCHEFCDTTASRLFINDCNELINEQFGDQIGAIQSYTNEFGELDLSLPNIYNILAYWSLITYIREKIEDHVMNINL